MIHRHILTCLLALAMSGSATAGAQDKLAVVATFSILADMTQRVGGDRVAVTTLVGPEQDAHVFQPSPAAGASVAKARIVISNGLGFEGWMERLISSSGYKGPLVVATAGITAIKAEEAGHGHQSDGDGRSDADPHAWQDLNNAVTYVENIRKGLCAVDVDGCESYSKNAKAYAGELSTLDGEIKKQLGALNRSKGKVITSHDAFGYFGKAYGVAFLAPVGISTEQEASAKDVARLITQIRTEKVTALFVEALADARLIEQIARETGVKAGAVLYSDALSKPDGPAATYLDMMRYNARELNQAMAGS